MSDYGPDSSGLKTEDGHQRIVRHGHLPEREVMTGTALSRSASRVCVIARLQLVIGAAFVLHPRFLPPYLRRSKTIGLQACRSGAGKFAPSRWS